MRSLLLLLLTTVVGVATPLQITDGALNLSTQGVTWQLIGNEFSTIGVAVGYGTNYCPFCLTPFQLVNPLPAPLLAQYGFMDFNGETYQTPPYLKLPTGPTVAGSVLVTPHDALPTVEGIGTYDALFDINGAFCVTPEAVFPLQTPNHTCFTVIGSALAHYTVIAAVSPGGFVQPLPTFEIQPPKVVTNPEPASLILTSFGLLIGLLFFWERKRSRGQSCRSRPLQ